MIPLALGLAALALLWGVAGAFASASVQTVKLAGAAVLALAGLLLAALLVATGRGGVAVGALMLAGPAAWNWWRAKGRPGAAARPPPRRGGRMSRAEALSVLGLTDPASDADIRAAWVRLMRAAHPDSGGTDWLAARVNEARDVLLGPR